MLLLQKAASGDRLDSHTYLRQNLGLAIAGTVTLFYLWKTPADVLSVAFQRYKINSVTQSQGILLEQELRNLAWVCNAMCVSCCILLDCRSS